MFDFFSSDVTKVVVGHCQLQMTFEGTETKRNASLKQSEEKILEFDHFEGLLLTALLKQANRVLEN